MQNSKYIFDVFNVRVSLPNPFKALQSQRFSVSDNVPWSSGVDDCLGHHWDHFNLLVALPQRYFAIEWPAKSSANHVLGHDSNTGVLFPTWCVLYSSVSADKYLPHPNLEHKELFMTRNEIIGNYNDGNTDKKACRLINYLISLIKNVFYSY